jgi:hypothetical protein
MIRRLVFKLSLRVLGLVLFWRATEALPIAGAEFCSSAPRGEGLLMLLALVRAALPLYLSYRLIRGSPLLLKLVYPRP